MQVHPLAGRRPGTFADRGAEVVRVRVMLVRRLVLCCRRVLVVARSNRRLVLGHTSTTVSTMVKMKLLLG